MYSVSSKSSKAIIYDYNTVFSIFALNEFPATELEVNLDMSLSSSSTASVVEKYTPLSKYMVNVDIYFKRKIDNAARIQLRFLKSGFKFTGVCNSTSKTTQPIITAVPTSLYKCTYDLAKN